MHILTVGAPIDLGSAGTLKPGRYIVEDVNAFELGAMADRGTASLISMNLFEFTAVANWGAGKDWNGKRVLFMRSGGFGDMLYLTPILREMRRRWPKVHLSVACRPERYQVFSGLDYPDAQVQTPVSVEIAASFDAVISFEHVIENEKVLHYVDALAAHMGLTLPDGPESRRIEYKVSAGESWWARFKYPRKNGKKRLGIQMSAGCRYRSYPKSQLGGVAMALIEKGWEIFLFGQKSDAPQQHDVPGIRNLTNSSLSFRKSVAALQTCDVVLAPDSSLLHASGALGIPAVGLFAAIPAKMRIAYAPSITALEGTGKCAQCFWHVGGGREFPKAGECAESGRCEPLARISVESIVAVIESKVA